jgi:intracellular sulfur oxidation DsrE/DsrF family protein
MFLNIHSRSSLERLNNALGREVVKMLVSKRQLMVCGNTEKARKIEKLISEVSIVHENLSLYLSGVTR